MKTAQRENGAPATRRYRTMKVDGLSIFYREAGPTNAPTLLLLHGLPSSSRMFESLMQRLGDRYHLIAPDYPGFGHSEWPDPAKFGYTFDRYAEIITRFTEQLGISRSTRSTCRTHGGPARLPHGALHPERVEALIVQNAVASRPRPRPDLERAASVLGRSPRQ